MLRKIRRYLTYQINFRTGRLDPLIPPPSLHTVGSPPDFVAVGEEFFGHFVDRCGLKPQERVLDVGCGTGRLAKPLTRFIDGGKYDGLDIVEPSIRWCQETYKPRYPNFDFHFANIYNQGYNKGGAIKANEYKFPFPDQSFDFVFLTSVFTHMLREDLANYLSEIARVLKREGRCLITYFLMNEESLRLISKGISDYSFKNEYNGCRVESLKMPEAVVGYDESQIRTMYQELSLNIVEPILYGRWCKREPAVSYQDIIIANRP